MTATLTDLFCGAGGSAHGAAAVAGLRVVMAANHWPVAVGSHQANFPHVDHDCADLSQVDPRRYRSTTILWASPECTKHTVAHGRPRPTAEGLFPDPRAIEDPAAERSRATMWDVARFAEYHRYRAIVVENVVEAARWIMFPAWLHAMDLLGYHHRLVWLNSMYAPTRPDPAGATPTAAGVPQSRDRLYVVLWRAGQPAPDVELRPAAWCGECGDTVAAVQSWKRTDRPAWGRYRAQYRYRCPRSACRHAVVEPTTTAAATVVDRTLTAPSIGARPVELAEDTVRRIRIGLRRYCAAGQRDGFVAELRGGGSTARSLSAPLSTVTASGTHHALVEPPAAAGRLPEVEECGLRMLAPHELAAAMGLPPGYVLHGGHTARIRQIGNAVTPPAAAFLLRAVVTSLGGTP